MLKSGRIPCFVNRFSGLELQALDEVRCLLHFIPAGKKELGGNAGDIENDRKIKKLPVLIG